MERLAQFVSQSFDADTHSRLALYHHSTQTPTPPPRGVSDFHRKFTRSPTVDVESHVDSDSDNDVLLPVSPRSISGAHDTGRKMFLAYRSQPEMVGPKIEPAASPPPGESATTLNGSSSPPLTPERVENKNEETEPEAGTTSRSAQDEFSHFQEAHHGLLIVKVIIILVTVILVIYSKSQFRS